MYQDVPLLAVFVDYWNSKRRGRAMPARADIDPTEIPKLLPTMTLIDVVDGGARFRYRLVGTGLVEGYGIESTGRFVEEVIRDPATCAEFIALYRSVCNRKRPVFVRNRFPTKGGYSVASSRVLAPLSRDGETVDMLATVLVFDNRTDSNDGIDLSGRFATLDVREIDLPSVE